MAKISIDFDGVILGFFLNREWKPHKLSTENWTKSRLSKNQLFLVGEKAITGLMQNFRHQLPGTFEKISELEKTNELILITARQAHLQSITNQWLKTNEFDVMFNKTFFNLNYEVSWKYKLNIIKQECINIHLDDDYTTCLNLASKLPDIKIIKFNSKNNPEPKIEADNVTCVNGWDQVKSKPL